MREGALLDAPFLLSTQRRKKLKWQRLQEEFMNQLEL